ncbi:hypothetical protein BJY04DRAFT_104066 [Aspergillus karnatakaensis]|uniref:uncharacterized protein n=1 Tax=Aspergillus karnatakaensis TaxID=1810916 RepID=UPI003CCE346C
MPQFNSQMLGPCAELFSFTPCVRYNVRMPISGKSLMWFYMYILLFRVWVVMYGVRSKGVGSLSLRRGCFELSRGERHVAWIDLVFDFAYGLGMGKGY